MFKNLFKSKNKQPNFDLAALAVDMHSHLIPGIDDGAANMDESIALLAKFDQLGYKKVITTPHVKNEVYPNTAEIILNGLNEVRKEAFSRGLSIQIEAAAEYFFDETLIANIQQRNILVFGDNFVLVEYSFNTPPVFDDVLFFEMQTANYKPILAHFERYPYYHGSLDKLTELRNKGVDIQLNLNSLCGHYGPAVKKQSERMIDAKMVDFVATDCHRMQHLTSIEQHVNLPYFQKLGQLPLKNKLLL